MTQAALAEKVAVLERQVAELKAEVARLAQPKDWRSTIGMFTGDEVMKEIFEEGRKIREKDREKARKEFAKSKKIKARA